jgi:hypothetical protein
MSKSSRKVKQVEIQGDGLIGDLIDKVLPTRKQFPPKVRKVLATYGDKKIKEITVARNPIQSYVTQALSWLSGGKLDEELKNHGYDDFYHLFMIVTLEDGTKLLVEKNDVVNMKQVQSMKMKDSVSVPVNKDITFGNFIDNAVKKVGPSIYLYDHINNNCQIFLKNLLQANGLYSSELEKFIMQDVEAVLKSSPSYVNGVARLATETKAKLDMLLEGNGAKRKRVQKPLVVKVGREIIELKKPLNKISKRQIINEPKKRGRPRKK